MGNPFKARKRVTETVEVVEDTAPETPNTPEEATSEVPTGTIKEVLDWVGDDADRAVEALTEEESGERRKTLTKALEDIIEKD